MEAEFTEKSLTVSMAVVRGITEVDTALLSAWNIETLPHFLCQTMFCTFATSGRIRRKEEVSFQMCFFPFVVYFKHSDRLTAEKNNNNEASCSQSAKSGADFWKRAGFQTKEGGGIQLSCPSMASIYGLSSHEPTLDSTIQMF